MGGHKNTAIVLLLSLFLCLLFALSCDSTPTQSRRDAALALIGQKMERIKESVLTGRFHNNVTNLFSLIPGRYPDCVSFSDVLERIPDGPQGKAFLKHFSQMLFNNTGIEIPVWMLEYFFYDSSALLNFLHFSVPEMYAAIELLNIAYQSGLISYTPPPFDVLPDGFDLANSQSFPLNMSWYYPGPPVELAPGLWQGFIPGNASMETIRAEIVLSLAMNQLANNSHLPNSAKRFSIKYNGETFTAIDDLLTALMKNGHTVNVWLTWRAVDFFGYRTKTANGEWRQVPVPVMIDTGTYDANGNQAIIPAIHDELVIQIKSGPNTKGYAFNGELLWYEGNGGIGFFARDLYDYASWVGTHDEEHMEGAAAVNYTHLAGVLSDVLVQSAIVNNLYGLGYGATGICVDSVGTIEYTVYDEISLYPLMMNKELVQPLVQKYYDLNNRDVNYYSKLLKSVEALKPDIYSDDPTKNSRALHSLAEWPNGREPFQCVIDAKRILAQ